MSQPNNQNRPLPPVPPPIPPRAPRPAVVKEKRVIKRTSKPLNNNRAALPIRREVSAGGVVLRREGREWLVALLKTEHKRGMVWVLPKGHVEVHAGERVSQAAGREVREEAGLQDLSVKDQLGVTRFKFQAETAVVHKTVHYFLMTTNQRQLTPQLEEGLLEAAWFPIDEAIKRLAYDTDQDIVARAKERMTGMRVERGGVALRRNLRIHT